MGDREANRVVVNGPARDGESTARRIRFFGSTSLSSSESSRSFRLRGSIGSSSGETDVDGLVEPELQRGCEGAWGAKVPGRAPGISSSNS